MTDTKRETLLEMAYDYASDMTCFSNIVGAIIETSAKDKKDKIKLLSVFWHIFSEKGTMGKKAKEGEIQAQIGLQKLTDNMARQIGVIDDSESIIFKTIKEQENVITTSAQIIPKFDDNSNVPTKSEVEMMIKTHKNKGAEA